MELGQSLDQLSRLPSDVFAERPTLRVREIELGAMLREFEIPGAEDIKRGRSESAASKAGDEEVTPVIVSPSEMVGMAGGW